MTLPPATVATTRKTTVSPVPPAASSRPPTTFETAPATAAAALVLRPPIMPATCTAPSAADLLSSSPLFAMLDPTCATAMPAAIPPAYLLPHKLASVNTVVATSAYFCRSSAGTALAFARAELKRLELEAEALDKRWTLSLWTLLRSPQPQPPWPLQACHRPWLAHSFTLDAASLAAAAAALAFASMSQALARTLFHFGRCF
eukprot:CAMPEP_0177712530 /NCGR_PEP_ID=MMETSP0484_2-20121128/12451_1 /TAXON_ID=354590 /ORGANISM="Rhodomonas lens, Strain RHODO" /LENGTH=201 /DNA_ID=CAMNT_0019224351 /DNA_START=73 /DNA_END=676 /DNA_ORIENTATION=+